jgi:hypothetical protein
LPELVKWENAEKAKKTKKTKKVKLAAASWGLGPAAPLRWRITEPEALRLSANFSRR